MAPDINPIYAGLQRSCPRDSKNVLYVDEGLVLTGLYLIESWGWWWVGGCLDSVRTYLSLGLNNLQLVPTSFMLSSFFLFQNTQKTKNNISSPIVGRG